ncbi:MAG: tetratricopeptide repeat protein [Verrucomicrobiia bacterium]|jgi:hypothetical protein
MNAQLHDRRWLWWGAFFIALLAIAAHWPGVYGQFVEWDDSSHVTKNPAIRALTPHNLRVMFTEPTAKLYIPLTCISFAVDYQIWGQDPFGYHFTNLLLHLANTLLVLVLVYRILRERCQTAAPVAVLTAALFGVHPMRVESVAWVTERKDVLFAFFFLLALLAYWPWMIQHKRTAYWWSFLLFIASALSKSTAVTFPLVLILFDWFLARRRALSEKIPFLLVSLIVGAATFVAQASGKGETVTGPEMIPIWARIGLVGYCSLFYMGKFLWPFHLTAIYPTFEEMDWMPLTAVAWLAGFAAVTAVVFALRKKTSILLPCWLFYLATLSPTIGIVPVGVHVVAERFSYVPLLGLAVPVCVGLVTLARRGARHGRVAEFGIYGCVGAWLVWLGALTVERSGVWANTETLLQNVLQEHPQSYPALVNLTVYYTGQKRLDEAIAMGQRAVEVAPNGIVGRKNLAMALIDAGRYRDAVVTLRPAVEHGIDDPAVWRALYDCFTALGDEKNAQVAQQRLRRSTGNF